MLLKDFPLPNDATFAELKRSLRSDQASAIGMHVSKIGSAIAANLKGGNQYDAAVDEMIFYADWSIALADHLARIRTID